MTFTECPECGEPLEATASVDLTDVEVDEDGRISGYKLAFAGTEGEFDDVSIYCPNDHPFNLERAKEVPCATK